MIWFFWSLGSPAKMHELIFARRMKRSDTTAMWHVRLWNFGGCQLLNSTPPGKSWCHHPTVHASDWSDSSQQPIAETCNHSRHCYSCAAKPLA
jgi:hypothetical protein